SGWSLEGRGCCGKFLGPLFGQGLFLGDDGDGRNIASSGESFFLRRCHIHDELVLERGERVHRVILDKLPRLLFLLVNESEVECGTIAHVIFCVTEATSKWMRDT